MARPLTDEQLAVVRAIRGEVYVQSAAGSGKTTVAIERTRYTGPHTLLLAYNVKAKDVLRQRMAEECVSGHAATVHGFCLHVLKRAYPHVPRIAHGRIVGPGGVSGAELMIKSMREVKWDGDDWSGLHDTYDACREIMCVGHPFEEALATALGGPVSGALIEQHRAVFATYEHAKEDALALDFSDMLAITVEMIRAGGDQVVQDFMVSGVDHLVMDECLPGDTPVLLSDGTVATISDIVDNHRAVSLLSYNEATGKQEHRRVIGWKRTLLQRPVVRILARRIGYKASGERMAPGTERLRFGHRIIVCTADHRIFVDGRWVAAGDIVPGQHLHIESSAPKVPEYMHKYKHSPEGKMKLAVGLAARVMPERVNAAGPLRNRGGNGKGLTVPQQALLAELGPDWVPEYVVPTRKRALGYPTSYKIDIAHPGCKIAIEIDGESHRSNTRKAQDIKKTSFLAELGWIVKRYTNTEAVHNAKLIAASMPRDCPVEAEVVSVEPYEIKDYYVYDIAVEGTQCYYANGILVHNCQDANEARWFLFDAMARVLVPRGGSVLAVGDARQCLYAWQGAKPDLFLDHITRPGATALEINTTFRSTRAIVAAGNAVAALWGLSDTVARADAPEGGPPRVLGFGTVEEEIAAVAGVIKEAESCGPEHTAVLARTNSLLAHLECGLVRRGIGFVRQDGTDSVWSTRPGEQMLGYARAFESGCLNWDTVAVLNRPNRYIRTGPLKDRLRAAGEPIPFSDLRGEDRALDRFIEAVDSAGRTPEARAQTALRHLLAALERGARSRPKSVALVDAAALYRVLARELGRHEGADAAVREFSLCRDAAWRVSIGTVHSGKGQEWPRVILFGASTGVLPHARAVDAEEERRILYVAVTRAISEMVITWSGAPSEFLSCLDLREAIAKRA